MFSAIRYDLCNLKNVKNTHGVLLLKVTLLYDCFSRFLIAQMVLNCATHHICTLNSIFMSRRVENKTYFFLAYSPGSNFLTPPPVDEVSEAAPKARGLALYLWSTPAEWVTSVAYKVLLGPAWNPPPPTCLISPRDAPFPCLKFGEKNSLIQQNFYP